MKKIIFIEDRNVLKLRLELIFRKDGQFEFEGRQANAISNSFKKMDADLYIIDIDHHINGGVDLIKTISSMYNKPIIAISSDTDISHLKQVITVGCSDFIIKPFDDASLLYKAKKLLELDLNSQYTPNKYTPVDINENSSKETIIVWDKAFEINVSEIDEDHRRIIMSYQKLYTLMREGKGHNYYKELLSFLEDYVNTHFANEEKLHKKYNYLYKDEHLKIHSQFKKSIKELIISNADKEVVNMDVIRFNLFIKNWLVHHILVEDLKFGAFLKQNNITVDQ